MPLVLADRVRDTTTTTGTGTVTLSGTAPTGYQNFSVIGNGNTTYYTINAGSQWEVGIGTYSSTGPTLARTTVLKSSNANALVDFAAGVKDVFVTYPADEVVIQDGSTIQAGTSVLAVANGGTGVTASTGTGSVVLSTSPTLTTPNLGTPSAATLTNATGLPIVAGTTGTLSVARGGTGVTTSTGTGNVVLSSSPTLVTPTLGAASATSIATALGAVGTPSYTFTGDTNTGIYSPAADTLAFVEGGVEAMRIDSAGQVGIGGTAATGTTLRIGKNLTGAVNTIGVYNNQAVQSDVTSNASLFATFPSTAASAFTLSSLYHFNAAQGTIGATSAVTTQIGFLAQSSLTGATNNYGFYSAIASGTGRWNFYAAGTAVNYFEGNVGIGVTPVDKLQVEGNLYFGTSNRVVYTGGAGNLTLQTNTGVLAFNTGGSVERMRITNAGRVGVNTSNPLSFLGVGSATGQVGFNIGTSSSPERGNLWYDTDGTGWKFNIGKFQSSTFTAQMTFQDNGDVGIGTSSPGVRLDVAGGSIRVGNTHAMTFRNLAGTGTATFTLQSDDNFVVYNAAGTPIQSFTQGANSFAVYGGNSNNRMLVDSGSNIIYWNVNGSERVRIDSSGNVGIGTSAPSTRLTAAGVIRSTISGGTLDVSHDGTNGSLASSSQLLLYANGANNMIFHTNGSQRLIINSTGAITSSDLADAVGYKGIPQNAQTAAYTLALSDIGKHISITTGGVVIPANGTVAFPIGSAVTIYNNSASNQTISITTDTLRLAGTATTGSRTLAQRGICTCVKVAATEWVISGAGLT